MKTKKIKLYNTNWIIKWVDNNTLTDLWNEDRSEENKLKEGSYLGGFCQKDIQNIYMNSSTIEEQQRIDLIHEVTHAIKMVIGDSQIESYDEENLCEFVSCHYDEITKILKKVYGGTNG